jgi:hypothetical protein
MANESNPFDQSYLAGSLQTSGSIRPTANNQFDVIVSRTSAGFESAKLDVIENRSYGVEKPRRIVIRGKISGD